MGEKYEVRPENGMLRIVALKNFGVIKKGNIGGLVESEKNLSHYGDAWVYVDAWVSGDAQVSGDADILIVGPIGSRKSFTTFCVNKKDILVFCGCWNGTLAEFSERVAVVYPTGKHADEYALAANMAEKILKIKKRG